MIERDHVEIELKFRLEGIAAGDRMLAAVTLGGLAASGALSVVRVEDRYIDTPSSALRRAGYAARLRARGDEVFVSVKSTARHESGRVHRRREVEGRATGSLDMATWPASDARTLLVVLGGSEPFEDLVTIRQVRRQRTFAGDGSSVELSVDEVQVVSQGRIVERFVEAEAELISGDATSLVAVGDDMAAIPGAHEATMSKLDAALAAIGRAAPAAAADPAPAVTPDPAPAVTPDPAPAESPAPDPARAETPIATAAPGEASAKAPKARKRRRDAAEPRSPGVRPDDSVAEAARKVLAFHLARMVAREPGTREGDVEELHQMRVATRRMRAAWRVFGNGFDARATKRHRGRLRRVAALLGGVRDLDVLLEGIAPYRAGQSASDQAGLDTLIAHWDHQREIGRRALMRELDGAPYRRWCDAYQTFVGTAGAGTRSMAPNEPQRIRDTAPSRIWTAFGRVRGYEPILRFADVPTLHELRITGKWLRYTMEFHAEAMGPDGAGLIDRVTALQDHLGLLHDADVAADLVRAFLVERAATIDDAERAAIGRYLADREAEVERLRRGVGGAWRGVAGLTFRRRLGRLVADL